MKTVQMKKKDTGRLLSIKWNKVPKGHQPKLAGTTFAHRSTRRNRTRSQQARTALSE